MLVFDEDMIQLITRECDEAALKDILFCVSFQETTNIYKT